MATRSPPTRSSKLADLESREVLLAKFAGAAKASLFGAAYMFNAPLAQAARAVDALREKQDSAASSPAVHDNQHVQGETSWRSSPQTS